MGDTKNKAADRLKSASEPHAKSAGAKKPVMTRGERAKTAMKHFYRGMDWLNENNPGVASNVAKLGLPKVSNVTDTACVVLNKKTGGADFHINADFFEGLTDGQSALVITHEFYHVILRHLHDVGNTEDYPNQQILRTAQEVVINDSLIASGHEYVDGIMYGFEMFEEDFGRYTTKRAYERILEIIEEKKSEQQEQQEQQSQDGDGSDGDQQGEEASGQGGSGSAGGGEQNGEGGSGSAGGGEQNSEGGSGSADGSEQNGEGGSGSDAHGEGACGGFKVIEDDGTVRDATDEEADEAADKMMGDVEDSLSEIGGDGTKLTEEQLRESGDDVFNKVTENDNNKSKSMMAGDGHGSQVMSTDERLTMDWVTILGAVNPRVLSSGRNHRRAAADWSRPSRYASVMRDARLPQYGDPRGAGVGAGATPEALLAMDFSGSIPAYMQKILSALARSIPERLIKPTCITFSTDSIPFDHKSDENTVASGGTDFSAVHRSALEMQSKSRKNEYPFVICMTDGYATFNGEAPTEQELERWIWVDIQSDKNSAVEPFDHVKGSFWGSNSFDFENAKTKFFLPYDHSDMQ